MAKDWMIAKRIPTGGMKMGLQNALRLVKYNFFCFIAG